MRRVVKQRLHHRVFVTLKSGETFDGILWEEDRQVWVLRNAEAVAAGEKRANVPVDGEVILLTADIAYAQRP